jgi:amino acid transporter
MGISILGLTAVAIWLYIGIEFVCPLVEEIIEPEKNIPRSMVMGLIVIVAVNLFYGFASIKYIPLDALAESDAPHVLVAEAILGKTGMIWIGIVSLCATASSVNTFVGVIPRMLYGMAQAGEVPSFFARVHPRFRTPWIGVLFVSCAYGALLLFGIAGIEQIMILIMSACACWLLAYVLAHVCVVVLRNRYPDLHRPYKTRFYPVPQIVGSGGMLYAIWAIYPEPITKMMIYKYALGMIAVAVAYSVIWLKFVKKVDLFKPISLEEEMGEDFAEKLMSA